MNTMKHPSRPVQFERRGAGAPRTPFKQKSWNHQDDLKAGIGKIIGILFLDAPYCEGELVAADQFTIKVIPHDRTSKSPLTFFKGSMRGYEIKA